MREIERITAEFELSAAPICARRMSTGSVHESWLVDLADGSSAVLQKINTAHYPDYEAMSENAAAVSEYLKKTAPKARFIRYISADGGGWLAEVDGEPWRAYRFVDRAHTPPNDAVSARDAVEAARALGGFHLALADFPVDTLKWTLPDHHNAPKRFDDFKALLKTAPKSLVDGARDEIAYLLKQRKYTTALLSMDLPARAVHNELRLSNVLLDNETGRAAGILSYDSVMPGLLCFDFGDLVHQACRLSRPDERVMKKIRFDLDRYADMTKAYIAEMRDEFDKSEPASLAPACIVMSLELGIRYLADYLTGSEIFEAGYPEQNLYRARTQLMMCMQMQYYFKEMERIVKRCL